MYQKSYKEYKAELDSELQKTAEGFVRIGYLLKVARDTNILAESGYKTVSEFAEAEYNLNKTQVSRFMSINDKFSKNGYSEELEDNYKGFGYAKLTIMLQLPDAVNEEITPEFSKTDVQLIKEEVDAERQVTDIEVMIEPKNVAQEAMGSNLEKAVYQLGRDNTKLYAELMEAIEGEEGENVSRAIQETLAPSGEGIFSIRIMGAGRLLLSVKELDRDITLTNIRTGEKERYTWEQMAAAVGNIMVFGGTVADSYRATYDELYPVEEKKEVAPVQQKTEPPKQKKQSKVTKAAKPVPKKPETEKETPKEEPERIDPEDVEIVENVENTKCETDFEENETVLTENETDLSESETEKAPEAAEIPNAKLNGRMTESDELGNWGVKGLQWKELQVGQVITQEVSAKLYRCLCKLKRYEETGLSPEEVERLAEKGAE